MPSYVLYNSDQAVAHFEYAHGMIKAYEPVHDELLPMQIRTASPEGFTGWIRERAIDLNAVQHRNLVSDILGSRDKVHLALITHMFSISDTFTCFEEGEFIPRKRLCNPQEHETISNYILLTSELPFEKRWSRPMYLRTEALRKHGSLRMMNGGCISFSPPMRRAARWRSAGY